MKQFEYTITDTLGIHARPGGELVKVAKTFASNIKLECNGKSADAKRLIAVMSLGAKQGQGTLVWQNGNTYTGQWAGDQPNGKGKLKIVDPCMADSGKFYPGFTQDFADAMAELCAHADLICPNLSEASFLLHEPYRSTYDETYIKDILKRLSDLGCSTAVLTGVSFEEGKIGAFAYDRKTDTYTSCFTSEEKEHFHGTGDLWASALCGALVNGLDLHHALMTACEFIREAIHLTLMEPDHNTYGVNFEQAVPYLIQLLKRADR